MSGHTTATSPSGCATAEIATLVLFVAARESEDRQQVVESPESDPSLLDVCDLAAHLLDLGGKRCEPGSKCVLSKHRIRALSSVANMHPDHPDFNEAWRNLTR